MALDADDRLRLDYEQTTQYLRTLIDVRFRLLAFVPTVTGVAVAIIGRPRPAAELLGVGVLGLLATGGIFIYELRNTQISGTLIRRSAELERQLQLPSSLGTHPSGGLYTERPGISEQLLGFLPVSHGLGLGLVAVLSFLAVVALLSAGGDWLAFFFLVPVLLGAASLFLGYRLWRRPYEEPPEGRSGSARR